MSDLVDEAAKALRLSARKPGMPTDHGWQIKQMHVALRKLRIAARQRP